MIDIKKLNGEDMIELIPTDPRYAELWHAWRSEANTLKFNPIANTSLEKLKERMALMSSDLLNLQDAEEFQFLIRSKGILVGTVGLQNISPMMGYGEINYGIGQNFQGMGVGTQAVRKFITMILSKTVLRRLIAYVAEDNIPSRKLLEKIGFKQEGVCREHYIINGEPTNEVLYGLLRREWVTI